MPLLLGTDHGLYRASGVPFDDGDVERVLDCGRTPVVTDLDHADGVFVAGEDGAYRSVDGGESWEPLGVPEGDRYWVDGDAEVWALHATRDGALFAGTNEPAVYRSHDDGESWHQLRGFNELDSMVHWESPEDPSSARVRSLVSPPDRPDRLIAGIEVGGVHVSDDGGETWIDHRDAVEDDVHQVYPLTADCWLAATGYFDLELERVGLETGLGHATGWGGLYRTTDAGETWKRLDVNNEYSYVRRVFTHDGTVFFCGARGAPPAWSKDSHEAALFESTNFGRSFERVEYPGAPHEVIEDWLVDDGELLCCSGLFDIPERRDDIEGRLLRRTDGGEYETVGRVPSSVGRIALI